MNALRTLMVPLLVAGVLIGSGAGAASAATCVSWTGAQPPSAGTSGALDAVAAASSCSAWAVGGYNNGTAEQTLIDHWNGSSWVQQSSPNPAGAAEHNQLTGVTATSTKNAWAVGYYLDEGRNATLIEHWNGSTWKQVASPTADRTGDGLDSVAATSAKDAWAVGGFYNGTRYRTLTLHWNGRTWKRVPSPNPSSLLDDSLSGVTIVSAKNAWAVGGYSNGNHYVTLIARWNGHSWAQVSSPTINNYSELYAIGGNSATSIWTVGQYNNGSEDQGLTLRCC